MRLQEKVQALEEKSKKAEWKALRKEVGKPARDNDDFSLEVDFEEIFTNKLRIH